MTAMFSAEKPDFNAGEQSDSWLSDPSPHGNCKVRQRSRRFAAGQVLECDVQAGGELVCPCPPGTGWRLLVTLEEIGGRLEARERPERASAAPKVARPLVLFPETMPMFGYSPKITSCRMVALSFELERVREHVAEDALKESNLFPRLGFADDDIWCLGRMLASQLDANTASNLLYCESLIVTMISRLAIIQGMSQTPKRGGLTKAQLRRSLELIESNYANNVSLSQLAETAGLSQSYFMNAFKVSTGMSPHRWILSRRVEHAQTLMLERANTLSEVALQTGFCDQSHFTRVFQRVAGMTPARWRRDQGTR